MVRNLSLHLLAAVDEALLGRGDAFLFFDELFDFGDLFGGIRRRDAYGVGFGDGDVPDLSPRR